MTVELLKDLKTKQYIIKNLKKENYINNVTCAKGNKFLHGIDNIPDFLVKNTNEDFKLAFILYCAKGTSDPLTIKHNNILIEIYNRLIQKYIKSMVDINDIDYYLNTPNNYYDAFLELLQEALKSNSYSGSDNDDYHVVPLLFNVHTKETLLFALNDINHEFLNDFMSQQIISYVNSIKTVNDHYTDISFLLYNLQKDEGEAVPHEVFELNRIKQDSALSSSYAYSSETIFYNKFLNERTLALFSCLNITKKGIEFTVSEQDTKEFNNYQYHRMPDVPEVFYDRDENKLVNIAEGMWHPKFALSLDDVKKSIYKFLANSKQSKYMGSVVLINYLFETYPEHLFLKFWDNKKWINTNFQEQVQREQKHSLSKKTFSKQLAQADIASHYVFVQNKPHAEYATDEDSLDKYVLNESSSKNANFSLYPSQEFSFDVIPAYKEQTDNFLLNDYFAHRVGRLNKFKTPYNSNYSLLYAVAENKGIPLINFFITDYQDSSYPAMAYIPSECTKEFIEIAKKTVHVDFKYSVTPFIDGIDFIILSTNSLEQNVPFFSVWYASMHQLPLEVTMHVKKKIVLMRDEKPQPSNWLQSFSVYTGKNSDTFPMLLNMVVHNNENHVDEKGLFTSDFFKQELLSL